MDPLRPSMPPNVRASRVRACAALCAFGAGVWTAREFGLAPAWPWFAGAGALAILAALARGGMLRVALFLAMACLGAAWYALRLPSQASPPLTGQPPTLLAGFEGIVLTTPRADEPPSGGLRAFLPHAPTSSFVLRARRVVDSPEIALDALLLVRVRGAAPAALASGQPARVTGVYVPPRSPRNPGEPDRRLLAAQDNSIGSLRLSEASLAQPIAAPDWWTWRDGVRARVASARDALRARARAALDSAFPSAQRDPRVASLVRALLLGEDDGELAQPFTRLGLLHALTISGFHLAVLAALCLGITRLIGLSGALEPALVAAVVLLYAWIVPPDSPILRSAIMVAIILLARALGRRYDHPTLLAWIALAILVVRPLDLWSLGFQLTFSMTAVLYTLAPALADRLAGPRLRGLAPGSVGARDRLKRFLGEALATNVACWLVASPVILFRTGLLSPAGVVAALVVSPLIVLVLCVGYALLGLGMLAPALAPLLSWPLRELAHGALALVDLLDSVPAASLRLPPASIAWTLAATLLIVLWLRGGVLRRVHALAGALVLGGWLGVQWLNLALPREVLLRVDALSVGDGSCLLVRRGREAMLWDAGSLSAGVSPRDAQRALRALGAWRVPSVAITHPDIDHYGLLPDLLDPLGVRQVLLGQHFLDAAASHPRGPEAALVEILRARGVEVVTLARGSRLVLDDATITLLAPPPGTEFPADNEASLVARVDCPELPEDDTAEVLLTGDLQGAGLAAVDSAFPGLRARLLEVPHHGSARADAVRWVMALDPACVLQSTGPKRLDDSRWGAARAGRRWLATAAHGAVWGEVLADGNLRAGSLLSEPDSWPGPDPTPASAPPADIEP